MVWACREKTLRCRRKKSKIRWRRVRSKEAREDLGKLYKINH